MQSAGGEAAELLVGGDPVERAAGGEGQGVDLGEGALHSRSALQQVS